MKNVSNVILIKFLAKENLNYSYLGRRNIKIPPFLNFYIIVLLLFRNLEYALLSSHNY